MIKFLLATCCACNKKYTATSNQIATLEREFDPMNFVCPECETQLDQLREQMIEEYEKELN